MNMLAIGCLGALLIWRYPRVLAYTGKKWKLSVTLGLVTLFLPFATRNIQGLRIETVFGPTTQAVGFLVLVLASISQSSLPMFRPLQWAPVVYLGTISYSLYLWHSIFLTGRYFGDGDNFLVSVAWRVSIMVGALSYHFLDLPINGIRRRYRLDNQSRATASPY
jgi:peptidoglycan/LPS O-acetylase OafA/YrhL